MLEGTMDETPEERPPHPLERLSGGGLKGGLLRLFLGVAIVAVVIAIGGAESWRRLAQPRMIPLVALGAALHLGQRAARIAKWQVMLGEAALRRNDYAYLLRAQLVGLFANLVAPVSEAVKIWAVAASRRDVIVATASIATDTALHAGAIALAGLLGILLLGGGSGWIWAGSGGLLAAAVVVVGAVKLSRRDGIAQIRHAHPGVMGWLAVETAGQIAVYALALAAIGVTVSPGELLALAPLLYLADLVVVTPSGLGVREALFAATLALLGDAPSDASVAAGLFVSSAVLVATVAGGLGALAWTGRHPGRGGGGEAPQRKTAGAPEPRRGRPPHRHSSDSRGSQPPGVSDKE